MEKEKYTFTAGFNINENGEREFTLYRIPAGETRHNKMFNLNKYYIRSLKATEGLEHGTEEYNKAREDAWILDEEDKEAFFNFKDGIDD